MDTEGESEVNSLTSEALDLHLHVACIDSCRWCWVEDTCYDQLRSVKSNLHLFLFFSFNLFLKFRTLQGNFFDEFQMEGVAADHNEIYLELMPENLSRALKTAQNAKAVKIKLTNKHSPCLKVAVELVSATMLLSSLLC